MKDTKKLNHQRYGELLTAAVPRVIRNDKELERLTALLLDLDERPRSTVEEHELAELLTLLIEQYEERHYAIQKATPLEVLRFLMTQRGLSPKDLWSTIGSKGITSEILSGKRAISITAAARLADMFHVAPSLFVDWDAERNARAS